MKFKELHVGQKFQFASEHTMPHSGMERGPWVKSSARKYHKDTTPFGTREQAIEHQEWVGVENQVGSINVEVQSLS